MATEPVVYLGGKFAPASQAHISIYNLGIVLGATLTDFLRTFHHKPNRVEDHVRRFYSSCKYARMTPPVTSEEATRITCEIAERNAPLLPPDGDMGIIYFITPGENLIYAGSAAGGVKTAPTFCIHTFPLPFFLFQNFFTKGIHMVTPSVRHVPPQCVDPKIKNRSRLHWWLADQEVHLVDPEAMTWLLDLDGNLTESGGSNVLLVKDGTVISPTTRNILLGTSRNVVIKLCGKLGIPFVERDVQVFNALTADEIISTNTPYCLAPVTKVNGVPIGDGQPGGPIFERLLAAYSDEVGLDIRAQFLNAKAPA